LVRFLQACGETQAQGKTTYRHRDEHHVGRERSDRSSDPLVDGATLPSDWNAIRDRWEFYHGLRTLVSLIGLACLFASTLSTREPATIRNHQAQRGDRHGSPRSTAA